MNDDAIALMNQRLTDLERRVDLLEKREAAEPLFVASAADVGERLTDVKNGILGAASSLLSKAANTIKPNEPTSGSGGNG